MLCYPASVDNSSAAVAGCRSDTTELYYACTTSCMKLFYLGDEHSRSLQEFVLVPLLWLPFAVPAPHYTFPFPNQIHLRVDSYGEYTR